VHVKFEVHSYNRFRVIYFERGGRVVFNCGFIK